MVSILPCLIAAVDHRLTSRLLDSCDAWWQPPAAIAVVIALVAFVIWMAGRDGAELPAAVRVLLATLRLAAVGAVIVALLDVERIAEHEIVLPSRVALKVQTASTPKAAEIFSTLRTKLEARPNRFTVMQPSSVSRRRQQL